MYSSVLLFHLNMSNKFCEYCFSTRRHLLLFPIMKIDISANTVGKMLKKTTGEENCIDRYLKNTSSIYDRASSESFTLKLLSSILSLFWEK